MFAVKFFLTLSFSFILTSLAQRKLINDTGFDKNFRYTGIQCQSFNPKIVRFDFCFVKKVAENKISVNYGAQLLKVMRKPIYLQIIMSRKMTGNFYQHFVKTERLECCDLLDGKVSNKFVAYLIERTKESSPDLLHKCPYQGFLNVTNSVLNNKKEDLFKWFSGKYKTEYHFYDASKKPIGMLRIDFEISV